MCPSFQIPRENVGCSGISTAVPPSTKRDGDVQRHWQPGRIAFLTPQTASPGVITHIPSNGMPITKHWRLDRRQMPSQFHCESPSAHLLCSEVTAATDGSLF